MKYLVLLSFCLLNLMSCILFAQQKSIDPILCNTGIYIKTLKINQVDEDFDILFYWWVRVDSIDMTVNYDSIKDIEVINADISLFEVLESRLDTLTKTYYVTGICKAKLPYKANFKKFPFDEQKLTISFENKHLGVDEIRYVNDRKNNFINDIQDSNIDILNGDQYQIKKFEHSEKVYTYSSNFGDPTINKFDSYSRIDFSIFVFRNPNGILEKIALPLFVVLFLAYLVFFIPDYEIGTASALTVTALLAAIAFQWTLRDSLPKVSYLTIIDKIFYVVYFFIFYAMVQTIFTFNLSKGSDRHIFWSRKIEIYSRYVFPISFFIIVYLLLRGGIY